MNDLTISERLASYGIAHEAAGSNGRLLHYGGRSIGIAHSDQAVALLVLLDDLRASNIHRGYGDAASVGVNQASSTATQPAKSQQEGEGA